MLAKEFGDNVLMAKTKTTKISKFKIIVKRLIYVAVLFSLFILSIAGSTYYHENAHVAIYNSYHINSVIEYDFLWMGGATLAEKPCPTEECYNMHNWNEIVGYSLTAFIIALWCIFYAYIAWYDRVLQ